MPNNWILFLASKDFFYLDDRKFAFIFCAIKSQLENEFNWSIYIYWKCEWLDTHPKIEMHDKNLVNQIEGDLKIVF
jgi:hypothetical protein